MIFKSFNNSLNGLENQYSVHNSLLHLHSNFQDLFIYLFIIMYNKITTNAWNEVQHKKKSRSTKNKNILTNKNKQSETQYKLSIQKERWMAEST